MIAFIIGWLFIGFLFVNAGIITDLIQNGKFELTKDEASDYFMVIASGPIGPIAMLLAWLEVIDA